MVAWGFLGEVKSVLNSVYNYNNHWTFLLILYIKPIDDFL